MPHSGTSDEGHQTCGDGKGSDLGYNNYCDLVYSFAFTHTGEPDTCVLRRPPPSAW